MTQNISTPSTFSTMGSLTESASNTFMNNVFFVDSPGTTLFLYVLFITNIKCAANGYGAVRESSVKVLTFLLVICI